jgi:hypothetical protein
MEAGLSDHVWSIEELVSLMLEQKPMKSGPYKKRPVLMFLECGLPTTTAPTLRFYVNDGSQGGIKTDFTVLQPAIGQVFFVGDGLTGTGTGTRQLFLVPPTATHLYLAYVDSCSSSGFSGPGCYFDNEGAITVTFKILSP